MIGTVARCCAAVAVAMSLVVPQVVNAQDEQKRQALVDKAAETMARFAADPEMGWFRSNIGKAEAVLIVPTMIKAGFIFGGSGGNGVLVARDRETSTWTYPAFYSMGSVTFGLQIGGEVSEIVLLVMTREGRDALLSDEIKLGGDVSVAAGPVGAGAKAQTADVLAFSRAKGAYVGLNVEGAVIATREDWNRSYYGGTTSASDIIVRKTASNDGASTLRDTVANISPTR